MFLNSWRIRLGIAASGVVLLLIYLAYGGPLRPKPGVLIEFGMYPDQFEGLQVEIDGKVVGPLKRFGQATRTGFTTSKGEHVVRVLHPQYECRPATVKTDLPGVKTMLILEFEESVDASGRMKQVLALRG